MSALEKRYKMLRKSEPAKYPARFGEPWSDDETLELLQMIQKKETDRDIAEKLERSASGIRSKRKALAVDYYFNNKFEIAKIVKFTGLSEDEVQTAITRKKAIDAKKSERAPAVESTVNKPAGTALIHSRIDQLFSMLTSIDKKLDILISKADLPPTGETGLLRA